ncbi:hypothetical protein MRX96_052711 [Rhipicephalus microplus]
MLRWPSFAFVWINSATHDDFNGGSSVDHLYRSFLENLHQGAYLQNTIVLFMSDHGFSLESHKRDSRRNPRGQASLSVH